MSRLDRRRVNVETIRLDIHEYRLRPKTQNRAGRGAEGIGDGHDFISMLHAGSHQGQQDRSRTRQRHAPSDISVQIVFEIRNSGSENERLLIADCCHGGHDFGTDLEILGPVNPVRGRSRIPHTSSRTIPYLLA